ncbi:hypothetical protein I4U23_008216 [Adineta vaga]|nr:hypothetical protein I4U23_008216 [Adineta vaga]
MYKIWMIEVFLLIHYSTTCTIPRFANLSIQSNFSIHHFLGIWYEIEGFSNAIENEFDEVHDFTQSFELDQNSSESILARGRARFIHEERCFSFGPWLLNINSSAKMILEKKDLNNTTTLNWPYYILKTDYEHYALIYSCMSVNYLVEHQCADRILWIFSRTTILSDEYLKELEEYVEKTLCINSTSLEKISHGIKSCYTNSAFRFRFSSIEIHFCLIVFILYLFLIYK